MKILALVPDPATAAGLAPALAEFPPADLRVVAYGQATAAALPQNLSIFVYPIRESSILPAPFLDALIRHEAPQVILAPVGAVTAAPVPVLLIDLDSGPTAPSPAPLDDSSQWGWIEALTTTRERRQSLLRAGLFSVDLLPDWFDGSRLRSIAAPLLLEKIRDLAGLAPGELAQRRSVASQIPVVEEPGPVTVRTIVGGVTNSPAAPSPSAVSPPPLPPRATAPEEMRPETSPVTTPALAPPTSAGPPEATPGTGAAPRLTPPPQALPPRPGAGRGAWPPVEVPLVGPQTYANRHAGGRVLILASNRGLDALSPADLAQNTLIVTPDALAWLSARMGLPQYVCMADAPRSLEGAVAVAGVRSVLVHGNHLDGEAMAPRSRARVAVLDLQRAGGPGLGWSDDLETGFFPASGDAALAVQWGHWIGAREILVAGLQPSEGRPLWPPFFAGAQELLATRGVRLTPVTGASSVPASESVAG